MKIRKMDSSRRSVLSKRRAMMVTKTSPSGAR
jgi:hypothetical protein